MNQLARTRHQTRSDLETAIMQTYMNLDAPQPVKKRQRLMVHPSFARTVPSKRLKLTTIRPLLHSSDSHVWPDCIFTAADLKDADTTVHTPASVIHAATRHGMRDVEIHDSHVTDGQYNACTCIATECDARCQGARGIRVDSRMPQIHSGKSAHTDSRPWAVSQMHTSCTDLRETNALTQGLPMDDTSCRPLVKHAQQDIPRLVVIHTCLERATLDDNTLGRMTDRQSNDALAILPVHSVPCHDHLESLARETTSAAHVSHVVMHAEQLQSAAPIHTAHDYDVRVCTVQVTPRRLGAHVQPESSVTQLDGDIMYTKPSAAQTVVCSPSVIVDAHDAVEHIDMNESVQSDNTQVTKTTCRPGDGAIAVNHDHDPHDIHQPETVHTQHAHRSNNNHMQDDLYTSRVATKPISVIHVEHEASGVACTPAGALVGRQCSPSSHSAAPVWHTHVATMEIRNVPASSSGEQRAASLNALPPNMQVRGAVAIPRRRYASCTTWATWLCRRAPPTSKQRPAPHDTQTTDGNITSLKPKRQKAFRRT
jgi:hypothetical protein